MATYVSPSQIMAFEPAFGGCQRKWGWDKIAGIKAPPSLAQGFGTDTHQELEDYYRKQVVPNQMKECGKLAAQVLHLIPPMNFPVQPEAKFNFQGLHCLYTGIKDLVYDDPQGPGGKHLRVVQDYKTSSAVKYMKTSEVLTNDPQAIIYSKHEFLELDKQGRDDDQIGLRWVYMFTKTSKGRKVAGTTPPQVTQILMGRQEAADKFENYIEPVDKQITHARLTVKNVLDLEPNVRVCADYGGCPYQKNCNITPAQRAISLMTDQPKNPAEHLASLTAGAQQSTPAATAPAPGPGSRPPMPGSRK